MRATIFCLGLLLTAIMVACVIDKQQPGDPRELVALLWRDATYNIDIYRYTPTMKCYMALNGAGVVEVPCP